MHGTIAITDHGWYERLRVLPGLEEVNFWKPSASRRFHAPEFSPFLFKLRAPHHAICGFAFFVRYSILPDWLAWESFGEANGTASFKELQGRIAMIRDRISFRGKPGAAEIGCILLVQPVFFPPHQWVDPPRDWPIRTQSHIGRDLATGEGARVWSECLARAADLRRSGALREELEIPEPGASRYGSAQLIQPRLGQGTFRIAVTDAYGRACAVTEEHSLPALEAAHIRPYAEDGPHRVTNGLLLRADLHRLFDKGYVTVSPDFRLEVGRRLREDFANGRSYYPLHGRELTPPTSPSDRPDARFLAWHREHCYLGCGRCRVPVSAIGYVLLGWAAAAILPPSNATESSRERMNRGDLQLLAELRVEDARILLEAGRSAAAYYLLGYAVECGLKACVAKLTREHDFPDKQLVLDSYTHDLDQLLRVSGLKRDLEARLQADRTFGVGWTTVKDWTEAARYDHNVSADKAGNFLKAVTDAESGVLTWLKTVW